MDLLDRLKLLMEKTNDNNASLARNSGIPYTTIDGLFKKGYKNAYVSTMQKLSDYFNVTIDYLIKGTDGISDEALILASKYDGLDAHGKRVVDFIVDAESDRCKEERQRRAHVKESQNIIPFRLSVQSASAGTGIYLGPEEFETIFVQKNDLTSRASFGVPVYGDSMEPLYKNGDLLIVEATDDLQIGEVGIFTIEGEGYVKKRGSDSLISLNPAYDPISLNDSARCNGRVIGVLQPEWIVDK